MNEGAVCHLVQIFKSRRTHFRDEERGGRPSVISDDPVTKTDEQVCEYHQLPHSSWTVLYKVVTYNLGYHKFYALWVLKLLNTVHKTKWMGSALNFLSEYDTEGEEFLNRIMNGGET